jgi:hypothetical protein
LKTSRKFVTITSKIIKKRASKLLMGNEGEKTKIGQGERREEREGGGGSGS